MMHGVAARAVQHSTMPPVAKTATTVLLGAPPSPEQKAPPVERCVRFVGAIAANMPLTDAAEAFMERLMRHLSDRLEAAERPVRFRASQCLACVLQALPQGAGVDEELAQELSEALRSRLRDKGADVRLCAARALGRLPAANEVRAAAAVAPPGAAAARTWRAQRWHAPAAKRAARPASRAARPRAASPHATHPNRTQDGGYAEDPAACALIERLAWEKSKDVRAAALQVGGRAL